MLRYLGQQKEKSHGVAPVRTCVRRLGAGRQLRTQQTRMPLLCGPCRRKVGIESWCQERSMFSISAANFYSLK